MKRLLNKIYWNSYYLFYPQHKSLRKAIPRSWADLDDLTEEFLDQVIISFVEEENGLDQISYIEEGERMSLEELKDNWGSAELYNEYRAAHLSNLKKLSEIYTWVRMGRAIQQKIVDEAHEKDNFMKADAMEKELYDKNTEYYLDLVRLRGYLWT